MNVVPKITVLDVATTLDLQAERILNAALKEKLAGCFVIGVDSQGELYFASTYADGGTVLWWMEKAKKALLEAGE